MHVGLEERVGGTGGQQLVTLFVAGISKLQRAEIAVNWHELDEACLPWCWTPSHIGPAKIGRMSRVSNANWAKCQLTETTVCQVVLSYLSSLRCLWESQLKQFKITKAIFLQPGSVKSLSTRIYCHVFCHYGIRTEIPTSFKTQNIINYILRKIKGDNYEDFFQK